MLHDVYCHLLRCVNVKYAMGPRGARGFPGDGSAIVSYGAHVYWTDGSLGRSRRNRSPTRGPMIKPLESRMFSLFLTNAWVAG